MTWLLPLKLRSVVEDEDLPAELKKLIDEKKNLHI